MTKLKKLRDSRRIVYSGDTNLKDGSWIGGGELRRTPQYSIFVKY